MRRTEKLPTPQGVDAGQTATINLPLGPTYHRFDIRMQAATGSGTAVDVAPADWADFIEDIRIIVDGDVKIEATADHLAGRALYYGNEMTDGVLPIFLSMPWARTIGGEDQTAYGTLGNMATFTMEIDLKSNINVGLLRVYAEQSEPQPFGPHLRIQRFASSFAAVGTDEISDLPRGSHLLMGIDVTSADVGDIEILANNQRIHVSDQAIRANRLKIAKRKQQAAATHIDFMLENRVNEIFPMAVQDFRVKLDFTAAPGAFSMYLTTLQGL